MLILLVIAVATDSGELRIFAGASMVALGANRLIAQGLAYF